MNTLIRSLRSGALLAAAVMLAQGPAYAGSGAGSKVGVEKFGEDRIRDFALEVNDELDQRKVNLAIIARAGRPRTEMPKGISYTHVAVAVFEPVKAPDGAVSHTYTVYNLYQGAGDQDNRSYLAQDLTYDFVAGIAEPEVAVCVPNEILQQRILQVIRSPAYKELHIADYNLLANPWIDRYDNCVTHTLKVCVAAIYETDDRSRIYRNIRTYFEPTPVRLGPVKSLGTTFMSSISRKDMDRSGFQTATYDSLKVFLENNGLVKESFTVALN